MIARRWHGRVPAAKAEEYLKLMKDVGLADYRSTAGQSRRLVPPPAATATSSTSRCSRYGTTSKRSAASPGDELTQAKYYDFDPDFLLELEPEVTHFEVIEG